MPSSLQLRKIERNKVGIRFGHDAEGAAYAMTDLGDRFPERTTAEMFARIRFITDPERGGDWERSWAEMYYNSVLMIKLLAPHGRLLVVSGATPTAERYRPGRDAIGHNNTFRKCNRLAPDSQVIAHMDYVDDTTVQEMLQWITTVIDSLPDPGNNFF